MSPEPAGAEAPQATVSGAVEPTAPAFALFGAGGALRATSEPFRVLVGTAALDSGEVRRAVGACATDPTQTVRLTVADPAGGPARWAHARAVSGLDGTGGVLLEVALARPALEIEALSRWWGAFSDRSEAVIWIKDLSGRYRYLNGAYRRALAVTPEQLLGHTDGELAPTQTIDGPRSRAATAAEPLALEYTVAALEARPAYTVLRFPISTADGRAVAVCGVASRAEDPRLAQQECTRLLSVLAWAAGASEVVRAETAAGWGLRAPAGGTPAAPAPPVAPTPSPGRGEPFAAEPALAAPVEVPDLEALRRENARLHAELADLRAELAELRRAVTGAAREVG